MENDQTLDTLFASDVWREVVDLSLALGQINSPHGDEGEAGNYVVDWLRRNGIHALRQEVLPGRYNAIGRLRGSGGGQSLIFNSHLDTAYGDALDIWTAGRFTRADTSAWIDQGRLYGQSVVNDKAPMAATLIAMKALKQAGIPLKGDLIFTGVAGEIGQAPIDEFQGPRYEGKGIGARYAVTHGIVADHALVAECTNWGMTAVECGCLLAKITIYGRAVYTPFLTRPARALDHPNAIVKAAKFIDAFEAWAIDYERRNSLQTGSGPVVPKASIGAIRGGLPFKPIETAGMCALYVDVRIPPDRDPLDALDELHALVKQLELDAEVEPYLFRKGYEGQHVETLQDAVRKAHAHFFADPPAQPDAPVSSMWRDLNVFNEVGIPSLTYGPPLGLSSAGWTYFIESEDVIRAAQVYALIALEICNKPKAALDVTSASRH